MPNKKDLEKLTFEEALEQLEKIVKELETGEVDLQSSISAYEKGVELKGFCEKKLKEAQLKIEKITIDSESAVTSSAVDQL